MKQARSIIWGIAIIALGVIFGGNALGLFDINIFFKGWWTLFIIIPAFISLLTDSGKLGSLIFMSAGIILLFAAQEVFSYDVAWKVILALILIAIGLSIVFKNFFHSKDNEEIKKKAEDLKNDKMDSLSAAFSGNERIYKKEVFSGSNLSAAFGGVELDLRDAIFEKDTAIKATCAFGGIEIRVPSDIKIKVSSSFIFGGISDNRKEATEKGKYTIYIDASGCFGGVEITDQADKD